MKKIILFILLSTFSYAQENYNVYHQKINKAEQLYFIENKVDSALYQYDKAFEEYSFNFLRDLVNAAQIAKLNKKPNAIRAYKTFLEIRSSFFIIEIFIKYIK